MVRCCRAALLGLVLLLACLQVPGADFRLRDFLKRAWTNERVSFVLTPAQQGQVKAGRALVGPEGAVAYQMSADGTRCCFLTDLLPFETREFSFTEAKAITATDLKIEETADVIRLSNGQAGIALAKTLRGGGPIQALRLRSGKWVGASSVAADPPPASYHVEVTARGPVSAEVTCRAMWADGGSWELRVRLDAHEPVVLFDETNRVNGAAAMTLRLDHGFDPNMIFYRYGGNYPGGVMGDNTVAPIPTGSVFILEPWLHWQYSKARGMCFSVYHAEEAVDNEIIEEDDPDLLTFGAREAGVWVDPALGDKQAPPSVELRKDARGLMLTFPLRHGQRKWMIATTDRLESLKAMKLQEKGQRVAPLPNRYLIKHGHFPLDLVKEYVLTWPNTDEHPREILTKADVARFRKSISDLEPYERIAAQYQRIDPPLYGTESMLKAYLATDNTALGMKIAAFALRAIQDNVDYLVQQDSTPFGAAPHNNSGLGAAPVLADFALGTGKLTAEERERLLAQLAFLGYTLTRPEYSSPERGYASLPNMTTSVYGYQTTIACAIPSHPLAPAWAKTAAAALRAQVHEWSDSNGGWLEAPHYAMVSYDVFVGSFLKLHNAGFADDLYDPQMRKIIEWFAKISTPPDARVKGIRHKPPIGNTYLNEPNGEYGILAYLWRDKDPEFAAQMQWMFRQQGSYPEPGIGGAYPALMGFRSLLLDPTIPEKAPAYGSDLFPRTGVILRSGFPTARETQLHLIAGDFRSHYDIDSGSITLWGKGRRLADDFGYYGCAPVVDHNRIESPQADANLMVTAHLFTPQFDYLRAAGGGWTRQIAFVKDADPLAPNYFVLTDTLGKAAPATWRLWCTAARVAFGAELPAAEEVPDADDPEVKGPRHIPPPPTFLPAMPEEARAWVLGKEDVDLDVFLIRPTPWTLKTEEKTRMAACGLYPDMSWRAMPSTQLGVIATQANATTLTTVLYPRLKTEKPPVVTALADGKGVKVQHAAGTDYLFLSTTPFSFKDAAVTFTGTAAMVKLRGKQPPVAVLGAEGTLVVNGVGAVFGK